jgi:hypothetical protein
MPTEQEQTVVVVLLLLLFYHSTVLVYLCGVDALVRGGGCGGRGLGPFAFDRNTLDHS